MRVVVAMLAMTTLATALAGCSSYPCTPGPIVPARTIAADAPSSSGGGKVLLTIAVQDPGGKALPGAGVAVYWGNLKASEALGYKDRPGIGEDGVAVEPETTAGTVEPLYVERLRTDGRGEVLVKVPADRVLGIVAAATGYTEEWVGHRATPTSGAARQVVTLFPLRLEWTFEEKWPLAGASPFAPFGSYSWSPHDLTLPGHEAQHMMRAVAVDVAVEWQNTPTAIGDLAAAVGTEGNVKEARDDALGTSLGPQRQVLQLDRNHIRQLGLTGPAGVQAGAAASTAVAAPFDLPYKSSATVVVDRSLADSRNCLYVAHGGSATSKDESSAEATRTGSAPSTPSYAGARANGEPPATAPTATSAPATSKSAGPGGGAASSTPLAAPGQGLPQRAGGPAASAEDALGGAMLALGGGILLGLLAVVAVISFLRRR